MAGVRTRAGEVGIASTLTDVVMVAIGSVSNWLAWT